MLHGQDRGFTLLELLISLTIVAVIVVIVFGALRTGIRAWEKGEKDVEARQRQRIVLDLIKRQLASICVSEAGGGDQHLIPLKGDNKSIEFVSCIPMAPGNRFGRVFVKYTVQSENGGNKEHLTFYEKNIVLPNRDIVVDDLDEDAFSELIPGMKSIEFEYLKDRPGEEASIWQETWDPAVDKGTPRAVRVTLRENVEKVPIYVIARIVAGE